MPDDIEKQKYEFENRINESGHLVKKNQGQDTENPVADQEIPILDELVTPDDFNVASENDQDNENVDPSFDDLAEIIEQKLSSELDEIVNLLKGNLKDTIMHELQDQIKKDPGKKSDV